MWLIIILCALAALIYYYIIVPMNYWKEKNVIYEKPLPLFGNMLSVLLGRSNNIDFVGNIYNKHSNERYVGVYNFRTPELLIRDPKLIKQLLIKEFDTFPNHKSLLPKKVDSMWDKMLFVIDGEDGWYQLRATLSPTFTSGKIKAMFGFMKECSQQFTKHFLNQNDLIKLDIKDAFARFSNDVISTTAFGLKVNSVSDPKNEFYLNGREIISFSSLPFTIYYFIPVLTKFLKLRIFNEKVKEFFHKIVVDTIKYRKENGIIRPDMLHLLIQAQKGQLKHEENEVTSETGFAVAQESEIEKTHRKSTYELTDNIITAQALLFFIGGFDTASTLMSFAAYELAVNPEVQNKLRAEVDETLEKSDGELTYDNLTSMKYLDMVISEALRKWPPFVMSDRKSVRPFTIQPEQPGESPVYLEKGSVIRHPIQAIHMDPQYYPNPEKFDPERFNEKNKSKIQSCTYLPFGVGPRNCIGSRFALLEGKLIIAEVVSKFEIVPVEKTLIPMVISKSNFQPLPDGGIWIGLKPRV